LITVDDLVDQDAADLIRTTVRAVHDVLARKVDFLGRFRPSRVGYAVHGAKDELYGLHAEKRGRLRLGIPASQVSYQRPLTALVPCPW
jgi:hypothetical protein